jgi:hypothetical protein
LQKSESVSVALFIVQSHSMWIKKKRYLLSTSTVFFASRSVAGLG